MANIEIRQTGWLGRDGGGLLTGCHLTPLILLACHYVKPQAPFFPFSLPFLHLYKGVIGVKPVSSVFIYCKKWRVLDLVFSCTMTATLTDRLVQGERATMQRLHPQAKHQKRFHPQVKLPGKWWHFVGRAEEMAREGGR